MPKNGYSLTKKLHKADLGGIEPPKLGSANAEALETQRRIRWATDPAMLLEILLFLYPLMAWISWISWVSDDLCKGFWIKRYEQCSKSLSDSIIVVGL